MKYREHDVVIVNTGDTMNAHKPGCRDILRDENYSGNPSWPATIRDYHDLVLEIYGPNSGSYFRECGYTMLDWDQWGADIQIMPCAGSIAYNIPTITDDDRAERYGDDREDV